MAPPTAECCYCGGPSTSRDHVLTRKLFPQPRPSDLITVPSCDPCNNGLSTQEEYFVHVLLSQREADTPVARELRDQLFAKPRNARRVRMSQRMLSATERAAIHTPAGLYLGHGHILTIDRVKLDSVVDKITRGLYFHAFGERVPPERISEVILTPPREFFQNEVVKQIVLEGVGGTVGGQAFEYRIARAPEPPGVAMCIMLFFGTLPVVCTLLRPEALGANGAAPDREDGENPGHQN
jgi:hypothetical protein